MKCQSLCSMKEQKNISKCRLLKLLPSMLSVELCDAGTEQLTLWLITTEPGHSISCKMASAPTEDTDQTANLHKLISLQRAICGQPRIKIVFRQTAKTLIRLHGCAG